jgi:nitrite reductase/ring-hydroxylating ferredoxin subunit
MEFQTFMSHDPIGRRGFLAGVLPLCCSTPLAPPASFRFEGATLVVDLARVPELRHAGSATALVDESRKLNLLVVRAEARRYAVLDRACTHGGASCTYMHKRRTLRCTSLNHAEYNLDGALLHGRTHGNLRAYALRVDGSRLEIDLEKQA